MEMPGIEPGASYMQSMRSTTELHPPDEIHDPKEKFQLCQDLVSTCEFKKIFRKPKIRNIESCLIRSSNLSLKHL